MPERGIATEIWDDVWFEALEMPQRYLFIYLFSNQHCNQAGLYELTLKKMSLETRIPETELVSLLLSLSPKVKWYPELDLVWVKNFLRRQARSSKFLIAAAKSLRSVLGIRHTEIIKEFIDYNRDLGIGQWFPDIISDIISNNLSDNTSDKLPDRLPDTHARADLTCPGALSGSGSSSGKGGSLFGTFSLTAEERNQPPVADDKGAAASSKGVIPGGIHVADNKGVAARDKVIDADDKGVAAGNEGVATRVDEFYAAGDAIPHGRMEDGETLREGDREIISVWCSVKGFNMDPVDASKLVASLRTEFPDVDILRESKVWAMRKLSEPLTPESRPAQQLWHWMELARKKLEQSNEERQRGTRAEKGFYSHRRYSPPDVSRSARAQQYSDGDYEEGISDR